MKSLHSSALALAVAGLCMGPLLANAATVSDVSGNSTNRLQDRFDAPENPPLEDPAKAGLSFKDDDSKIRFVLKDVKLDGNTALDGKALKTTWTDLVGHDVGVADVEEIARRIKEAYRAQGYPGTKVVRPRQDYAGGVVKLTVTEFRINKAEVRIDGKKATPAPQVQAVIDELRKLNPVKAEDAMKTSEKLAKIPGVYPLDMHPPRGSDSDADLVIELSSVPADQRANSFRLPEISVGVPPAIAEKSFVLGGLNISGSTLLSQDDLRKLFADKVGQTIRVADLPALLERVKTAYAKQNRAAPKIVVADQQVIEGFIDVDVQEAKGAPTFTINGKPSQHPLIQSIISRYGDTPTDSQLEYILGTLKSLPGFKVKAARIPKVGSGHPEIDLITVPVSGEIDLDNRGSHVAGPWEAVTMLALGNPLNMGDKAEVRFMVNPLQPQELKAFKFGYAIPVSAWGTVLDFRASHSSSHPGSILKDYEGVVHGDKVSLKVIQPIYKTSLDSLTTSALIAGSTPKTMVNNPPGAGVYGDNVVSSEHLRWVRTGARYQFRDEAMLGAPSNTQFGMDYINGLHILGASGWKNAALSSKQASDYAGFPTSFKLVTGDFQRATEFGDGWKTTWDVVGKWGFTRLPSSMQMALGGENVSPYDDGTIAGERGVGTRIEVAKGHEFDLPLLQGLEPYGFYDVGKLWTRGPKLKIDSLASAGLGVRADLWPGFNASVEVAKPLTTTMNTLNERRTKDPKFFLSLSQGF